MLLYNYMARQRPDLQRNETLKKFLNYSNKRHNAEIYYRLMPFETPAFKQRELLNTFGEFESTEYLTKTPVEDQMRKHRDQVKQ